MNTNMTGFRDGFQTSLHSCELDESSHSIGRVKSIICTFIEAQCVFLDRLLTVQWNDLSPAHLGTGSGQVRGFKR